MDRRKFSIVILSFVWINVIQGELCTTTDCVHASASILQRIDTNVNPCDNFYDFACGSFIEENYTPDESVAVDSFTNLKDKIDSQVIALLTSSERDSNVAPSLKLSNELYQTCLGRNRDSGDEDVKALKEIVEALGGWPLLVGESWNGTGWTLEGTVNAIRKTLGHRTDKIFDIASFIIHLENANNPSIRPSAKFFSLRSECSKYINNLATFLGATSGASEREEELNLLLDFEGELNTINLKYRELSGSGDIKAQSDSALKTFLYIHWLDNFHPSQMKNIQITEDDKIKGTSFAEEMRNLLNVTSTRTLANFVMFRLVDFVAVHSTSGMADFYIEYQKLIDGRQDRDQTWKKCIGVLSENLPFAIGSAYVKSYFSAEAKALVMEMFSNIKQQFTALITQAEWIDESSRDKLLSKLKSLVPLMAYPDHGFDERSVSELYDEVKLDKSQYLRTLFQLRVVDADNKFRQTYTSTALESSNSWKKFLPPTSVTALYSQSDNTIRFSAGILQNVVNERHTINYLEYGTTGFIVAHEISHIVNQILNSADLISDSTRLAYEERKRCIVEQYNEYREPDAEENLNGGRTFIENFADNTGIMLAYRAYRGWNENFTGKRQNLIGLNYTWDQLFWLSAGQTWCGVYRPEELERKISSDSYATERFRVIGPLSNSPDFAKDFGCSISSPMNRKNKCIIW